MAQAADRGRHQRDAGFLSEACRGSNGRGDANGAAAALEQQGWQTRSFAAWGVIAAPNFFGRVSNAQSIQRFQAEGAWGVSPHLIPHQSLHGLAGTLSQALKIHGPNFGVSGAPNAGLDALLIAAAMLADGSLPGLWVVLTGHESELIPERGSSALAVRRSVTRSPWP